VAVWCTLSRCIARGGLPHWVDFCWPHWMPPIYAIAKDKKASVPALTFQLGLLNEGLRRLQSTRHLPTCPRSPFLSALVGLPLIELPGINDMPAGAGWRLRGFPSFVVSVFPRSTKTQGSYFPHLPFFQILPPPVALVTCRFPRMFNMGTAALPSSR